MIYELSNHRYIHMTDLVDQMFPPIHRQFDSQFTDFNYWKPPMQEYELPVLTPPSPALSARSDTSNQSTLARLRNLSLIGGRPSKTKPPFLPSSATDGTRDDGTDRRDGSRSLHLRQMSSLERLSHTISIFATSASSGAGSPTASSSTFVDSGDEGDADEEGDLEKQKDRKKWIRRSSMPGSLGGSDDESERENFEDEEDDGYEGEYEDEAAAEQAFDDDLFATGEMENVPFL
jgi:phosphatidate phosphatase LPIN